MMGQSKWLIAPQIIIFELTRNPYLSIWKMNKMK
jgi:hypothetical protein